jgi:hypothetical protein
MTVTKTDELVEDYLHRLATALRPLPLSRRDQLVSEITEHIDQGRAGAQGQSEAGVRELLDRLGEPEDIAAAALSDEPKSRTRRLGGGLLIAMLVVVVLVAGFTTAGLFGAFRSGGGSSHDKIDSLVTVPNVVGMSTAQATTELQQNGLTSQVVFRPINTVPPGKIFSQSPPVGSKVELGSELRLTESVRPSTVTPSSGSQSSPVTSNPATKPPPGWAAEGLRLTRAEIAAHVKSSDGDFAYQSIPVNLTHDGTYTLDYGPIDNHFVLPAPHSTPPGKPVTAFSIAFDFPSDASFHATPDGGGSTVTLNGRRYYQTQISVSNVTAPYDDFTGWIYS